MDSPIHKLLRDIDDSGKYVDVEREHMEVVCSSVVSRLMHESMKMMDDSLIY